MKWDEYKDESGDYWVSFPYVIRTYGMNAVGGPIYRLEGNGVDSQSPDVARLKTEAELDAERTEFRKRLGV